MVLFKKILFILVAIFIIFSITGCQEIAKQKENQLNSCTDSDNGYKIFLKGIVNGKLNGISYSKTDFCNSSNILIEYYCDNENPKSVSAYCAYRCSIGACRATPLKSECTDTDGGINYYEKGTVAFSDNNTQFSRTDFCESDLLHEYYCNPDTNTVELDNNSCEHGCSNGICIQENTCADGTLNNQCSSSKPKYCDNGHFVYNCSLCGCQDGYDCRSDGICREPLPSCQDGTMFNACSSDMPYYCSNGSLFPNCRLCGCSNNYICQSDGTCNAAQLTCNDGTSNQGCSASKPLYCQNGALLNRCDICGCSNNYICKTDGTCDIQLTCSDGTSYNACSSNKPLYCSNGNLLPKCQLCGCSGGYTCQINGICYLNQPLCYDGTPYGQCSATQPNYCDNGNLVNKCSTCGCPSNKECNAANGLCTTTTHCNDGTISGECSSIKPKYCDNGILIKKCGTCGCLAGEQCQADGSCILPILSVSLSAVPSSGNAPLNDVDLTAQVTGTAAGPINYTFYCNRADSGTNIIPGYAHKKDGINLNPYTILDVCDYSTPGTYTAKVIVKRGGLAAENKITITVSEITPPEIVNPKVLLLIFNPIIESQGNKRLTQLYGWNNPDSLAGLYIQDIKEVSGNFVNYNIVERMEVDAFTTYTDGYSLDDATYLSCWPAHNCNHGDAGQGQPMIDYQFMIQQYGLCEKLNAGEIDEVWTFSYPYSGFWESTLAGPGAFWYNSAPVTGTTCNKLLPIMGFSYERGVGEMLEDMGHRTESVMTHVFGGWAQNEANDWNKFTLYDKVAPGKANCGNVHYGPNSLSDYDWGRTSYVSSNCDDWYNYPNFQGTVKQINCQAWGCEIRGHHKWWLKHLPKTEGTKDGKLNNWWLYIVDYNNI